MIIFLVILAALVFIIFKTSFIAALVLLGIGYYAGRMKK